MLMRESRSALIRRLSAIDGCRDDRVLLAPRTREWKASACFSISLDIFLPFPPYPFNVVRAFLFFPFFFKSQERLQYWWLYECYN